MANVTEKAYDLPTNLLDVPRRPLILSPDPNRWSKEALQKEIMYLIQNPLDLTYMVTLPSEALVEYYPGILEGRYVNYQEPSAYLKKLFQRMFAPDDQEFYQRVNGIVKGIFSRFGRDDLANLPIRSQGIMKDLYTDKTRNTGEAKGNHESRVKMQTLADAILNHEYMGSPQQFHPVMQFDPFDEFNIEETAVVFVGADFHDLVEDFTSNNDDAIGVINQFVVIQMITGGVMYVNMDQSDYANNLFLLLKAVTDQKYPLYQMSQNKTDALNMQKILSIVLSAEHPALSWGILADDMGDRDDNLRTMWVYSDIFRLDKFLQTFDQYRSPSILLWSFHPNNSPYPASAVLLRLLGASENQLYGWILENEELMADFEERQQVNLGPLIIPHVQQAILVDNSGAYRIVQRPGVSGEYHDFQEVIKKMNFRPA